MTQRFWPVRGATLGILLLIGLVALPSLVPVAGCALSPKVVSPLPAHHTIVCDQLAIYSDFVLPQDHPLIEDVRQMRGEMLRRLELPGSDEPVHVYLFDTEESYQKYLRAHYPKFPMRRAFFVTSDTRLAVYAHWGERISEDLRHEVAHGYLHSVVRKVPLWLDEGIAEFFEVPRSMRGFNTPHVELLVRKLQAGIWRPNLERLESLSAAGEMSQDDYAESWAWVHLMLEGPLAEERPLREYLLALRQQGSAESLAVALRRLDREPEHQLVKHLYRLGAQLETP